MAHKDDHQPLPQDNARRLGPGDFLIVGVGASAGGINALKTFFENVTPSPGIAYVVILHLSPEHESKLAEVLQTVSPLPVIQVKEQLRIERDHVYVVPPNQSLSIANGQIVLAPIKSFQERRAPVDIFFRTLAECNHGRAVGVILSGTGADGSMGIKRIKENGGVAFVQNPREAQFNDMPRNAIATDLIDDVLNVADIPSKIMEYKESLATIQVRDETASSNGLQHDALREIFAHLKIRTGHDFTNYKKATILRRIERRIHVRNMPDIIAYATFLKNHPDETQALLKDLLISVTNFFRDKRAFDALERDIIPRLFEGKGPEDNIRVWVTACATGEEAYSIAMLLAERLTGGPDDPTVQIFATDIDDAAITAARDAYYTLNDAADVTEERLRRFFNKEHSGYRVRREIREMILFANHNILKDPPFAHLDLATCRNMLIYFNQSAQERVFQTLHFALNPGGYLFVGSSESVEGVSNLYTVVDKEHYLYRAQPVGTRRTYPVADVGYSTRIEPPQPPRAIQREAEARALHRITYAELHQQLLEQYAPPSLVINDEYEIVHLSPRAGRYLLLGGGEPTMNLMKVIRDELRLDVRTAIYQAIQRQTNVDVQGIKLWVEDKNEVLNIHVRPVMSTSDTGRGFILIIFEPGMETEVSSADVYSPAEPVARQLEDELERSKSKLRTSIEQHEVQSEELKASNEELQAMNEELRSAAEELETSKEELQSVNEELITVNEELKIKIEELSHSNSNFQNLMNSTAIGTIFLDRSFRVNLFTPAARDIFNLIPADFGRPLSDITHRLRYERLIEDAETVVDTLHAIEREIMTSDDRVFLMQITPYRTMEDRIGGLVLTFFDITERKTAELKVLASENRMKALIGQAMAGVAEADESGKITLANRTLCAMTGYTEFQLLDQELSQLIHKGDWDEYSRLYENILVDLSPFETELRILRKDGEPVWVIASVNAIRNPTGSSVSTMSIFFDITDRKKGELQLRQSEQRYRSLFTSIDQGFSVGEIICNDKGEMVDYRIEEVNPHFERVTGISNHLISSGKTVRQLFPTIDERWITFFAEVAATGQSGRHDLYANTLDRWFEIYAVRIDEENRSKLAVLYDDITERRRAELNADLIARVNHDLVMLSEPRDILEAVSEKIFEHFNVSRLTLYRVNQSGAQLQPITSKQQAGMLPIEHSLDISQVLTEQHLKELNAGRLVCLNQTDKDTETKETLENEKLYGICSKLLVPFLNHAECTYILALCHSEPYNWRRDEKQLLQDLALRIHPRLERARAELHLRESEQRIRQLVGMIPAAIYACKPDGSLIYYNDFAIELWGGEPRAEEERQWSLHGAWKTVYPDGTPFPQEEWPMTKVLETGKPVSNLELIIELKDKRKLNILVNSNPIKDINETVVGVVNIFQDITESKKAEQMIRDKQLRLDLAQKAARVGIWSYDLETNKGMATPEWLELTGYPEKTDTWEMDRFLELVHPEDRQLVLSSHESLIASRKAIETEFRILHPQKRQQWTLMRASYIPAETNAPPTLMGTLIDITERKQMEEQKDVFIGIASHELKTPITSIKAFAEVLADTFSTTGDKASLNLISKLDLQIDRLANLVGHLLDTTKISQGQLILNRDDLDLKALLTDLVEEIQRVTTRHTMVIKIGKIKKVRGDRERLSQAFTNILSNAIKYSPDGGSIYVTATDVKDSVVVAIRDEGIGMTDETVSNLFTRFYRSPDSRVSTFPGLGLGLFITAEIIKLHDGTINVESKPGKGSTLTITLPYSPKTL